MEEVVAVTGGGSGRSAGPSASVRGLRRSPVLGGEHGGEHRDSVRLRRSRRVVMLESSQVASDCLVLRWVPERRPGPVHTHAFGSHQNTCSIAIVGAARRSSGGAVAAEGASPQRSRRHQVRAPRPAHQLPPPAFTTSEPAHFARCHHTPLRTKYISSPYDYVLTP